MVSCIEIETASLVFAVISLICSCVGTLVCILLMVHTNVLMAYLIKTAQSAAKDINEFELGISTYGFYNNIVLAISLGVVVVCLVFSIILIKGLLSKKFYLIKAYFIYGVTANTISLIFALFTSMTVNILIGLTSLFGCFLYTIILIMIKTTYLKISTYDQNQFSHKKLEAEIPIA